MNIDVCALERAENEFGLEWGHYDKDELSRKWRKWALHNHPDRKKGTEKQFAEFSQLHDKLEACLEHPETRPTYPRQTTSPTSGYGFGESSSTAYSSKIPTSDFARERTVYESTYSAKIVTVDPSDRGQTMFEDTRSPIIVTADPSLRKQTIFDDRNSPIIIAADPSDRTGKARATSRRAYDGHVLYETGGYDPRRVYAVYEPDKKKGSRGHDGSVDSAGPSRDSRERGNRQEKAHHRKNHHGHHKDRDGKKKHGRR